MLYKGIQTENCCHTALAAIECGVEVSTRAFHSRGGWVNQAAIECGVEVSTRANQGWMGQPRVEESTRGGGVNRGWRGQPGVEGSTRGGGVNQEWRDKTGGGVNKGWMGKPGEEG